MSKLWMVLSWGEKVNIYLTSLPEELWVIKTHIHAHPRIIFVDALGQDGGAADAAELHHQAKLAFYLTKILPQRVP